MGARGKISSPQTALLFTAEGCGSKVLVLPPISAGAPLYNLGDVVLSQEATVSGCVVDENGTPLPHVTIDVTHSTGWHGSVDPDHRGVNPRITSSLASRTFETDDIGRFHVGGLPSGAFTVQARQRSGMQRAEAELALAAGEPMSGVRLVLPAGNSISGRVWTADGRGVPNAHLIIKTHRGGFGAKADHGGTFTISGLDDRPWQILAYEPEDPHAPMSALSQELTGIAPGTHGLEIILPSTVMVRGTVLRSDGTSAHNASIRVKVADYWRDPLGYTDLEGRFGVHVPAGRHLDVFVKPSYPDIEMGEATPKGALATGYNPASGPLELHLMRE